MPHEIPFLTTISVGLGLAALLGILAHRLRLPLIVGYLTAGIVIGPFTPGFVADQEIAAELAEMGVILLMFGVGLHFSVRDIVSVRKTAIPGALVQMAAATLAGLCLGLLLGWGVLAGLIFGLSLSVASTVVLLRALQERDAVNSQSGKIAIGWLIVEDLAMVITLVLIPPIALALTKHSGETAIGLSGFGMIALTTLAKVAAFVAIMLVIGQRLIPMVLHYTARTGQRELFRLSVLAIALGVAFVAAKGFGVSFALGAFFAGMVMSGSTLSAQATKDMLPFRDAFAVLFFVSVGMLFNPWVVLEHPVAVLATIAIILGVKSVSAFALMQAFGYDRPTSGLIAASLAQIGEFSFILVVMGVSLGVVPIEARDLVVAGALVSIIANPVIFKLMDRHLAIDGATTSQKPPHRPTAP